MDYNHVVKNLSPDIVSRLRQSLEMGRWPDGRALTPQQKEDTMQALIAWDEAHLPEEQRVGYINREKLKKKAAVPNDDVPQQLRWADTGDGEQ